MSPRSCAAVVAEASGLSLSVASPALVDLHMEPTGAMPRMPLLKPSPLKGTNHDKEKGRDGTIVLTVSACD